MNFNEEKNYRDIKNNLRALRKIEAGKNLKDKILLMSKFLPEKKAHYPKIRFARAGLVFALFVTVATGAVFTKNLPPHTVVDSFKDIRLAIQRSMGITTITDSQNELSKENKVSPDTPDYPQAENAGDETNENDIAEIGENISEDETEIQINSEPDPIPTTKPQEILGEISESLPEPASNVINSVIEQLQTINTQTPGQNSSTEDKKKEDLPANLNLPLLPSPPNNASPENQIKINVKLPI